MSRMYPHTVTVWRRSEDGRDVTWESSTVAGARLMATAGRNRAVSGDASGDTVTLLLDGEPVALAPGDRFALGASDADEPPADAHTVTRVSPVRLGASVHHLEVGGA